MQPSWRIDTEIRRSIRRKGWLSLLQEHLRNADISGLIIRHFRHLSLDAHWAGSRSVVRRCFISGGGNWTSAETDAVERKVVPRHVGVQIKKCQIRGFTGTRIPCELIVLPLTSVVGRVLRKCIASNDTAVDLQRQVRKRRTVVIY